MRSRDSNPPEDEIETETEDLMKTMRSMLAAVAASLLLGGCLGGSGNATFADGYYRFIHVSPFSDDVSISVGGNAVVGSLAYHGSVPYVELSWGTRPIEVQSVSGDTTYVNSTIPVASNGHYSYFLYGGGSSLTAFTLRDDVSDAPAGAFYLRAINLATGIGAVDVYLLPPDTGTEGNAANFTALAYVGTTGFTPFPIGDYSVVVTPTGTNEVIYDSGLHTFAANDKTTLLVFATGSGKLVNGALLQNDASGTTNFIDNPSARFKFLGAATDVQPLDLLIDNTVALSDVPYGGLADYAAIASGNRGVKIQPTSNPGAYLYDQTQAFAAGTDNSLAAYSVQGTGNVGLIAMQDDNLPPPSGKVKLRVVNASSDSTVYDLYANSALLVSGLAAATASSYQVLDPATYKLSFDPTGTSTPAATVDATLEADKVYTLYAYGRSGAAVAKITEDY
jgi:hypothetical protein